MSSSRLLTPLYLLSTSILLQLTLATNPLFSDCPSSANFTANGPYNKNLNGLLSYLKSKTPRTGFGSGSLGMGENMTYGSALCRGDINSTVCQACVDEASVVIQQVCQLKEQAIIWYEYCMLKYSNASFLGKIDYNWWYQYNLVTASDPDSFNENVLELLGKLEEAAYVSPKLYAAGAMSVGTSMDLYGLVQCTGDLYSDDCKTCIAWATSMVPKVMYGKEGGKVETGSCNVRFEIYPFLPA